MIKYGLPVLAAVALVFATSSVIKMTPTSASVVPPSPPPAAPFPKQIGAVGLVEASSENIAVSLPVPGLVTVVHVRGGDRVKKGRPLFSLDDRDLRAELALRKSSVELAQARLEKLLAGPRPEEIPPAEARVREAKALLDDARVQLQLIERVRDPRAIRAGGSRAAQARGRGGRGAPRRGQSGAGTARGGQLGARHRHRARRGRPGGAADGTYSNRHRAHDDHGAH